MKLRIEYRIETRMMLLTIADMLPRNPKLTKGKIITQIKSTLKDFGESYFSEWKHTNDVDNAIKNKKEIIEIFNKYWAVKDVKQLTNIFDSLN